MSVDVCKLKDSFLDKMKDLFNQEEYFVKSCYNFPDKFSLSNSILDDHLRIYFEENNNIILDGCCVKFCEVDVVKKAVLADLTLEIDTLS